jgi:hypothetical protein
MTALESLKEKIQRKETSLVIPRQQHSPSAIEFHRMLWGERIVDKGFFEKVMTPGIFRHLG